MTTHKTAPEQPVQKATAAELAKRIRSIRSGSVFLTSDDWLMFQAVAAELARLADAELKLASDDGLYAEFKSQERRIAELEQRLSWRRVSEETPPIGKDHELLTYSAEYEQVDYLTFWGMDAAPGHRWFSPWSGNFQSEKYEKTISHWMPLPPIPDSDKEPT